jgi:hypothetical protein
VGAKKSNETEKRIPVKKQKNSMPLKKGLCKCVGIKTTPST